MSGKMVPELRFPDFGGDWESSQLKKWMTFKNGLNATKECYGRGRKFINVLDIINNDYITNDRIIGSVTVSEEEYKKNIVEFGDILFQRSSETREEVGQANVYLDKKYSATFGGFVIRGKKAGEYDPVFMNKLLQTNSARKEITSRSGGSTRYNVGQETLSNVNIIIPTLPEQTRIANFLTAVDKRITLLQKKKEDLELYKKGVMQKLFSGELRFKDEQGNDFPDWVEKKLGEIATICKGKGISKAEVELDGKTECIRYGELYTKYKEVISTVHSRTNLRPEGLELSKVNDIIIPSSGETAIDIATASCVLKDGIALGGDINIIRTEEDGVFLSYYLNNDKRNDIARLAQGISVIHLYGNQLKDLKMSIPLRKEQKRIAKFLSTIDQSIEKLTTQIESNQTWKKGLLQRMFV